MLRPGDPAPALRASDHRGHPVDVHAMCASGPVVVYFFPRDFTPGCTAQACAFRDAHPDFGTAGVEVVAISADDAETHRRFAERYALPFRLVSDPDRSIARAWDAMALWGLWPARVTYLVGRDGRIAASIRDELRMQRHVIEVRRALERLRSAG
ncbi:MAG: peroxiredoxin [Myxococcota bacterium]|nr:peroxiredoxin [Myxococcota bacterium]MDW8360871.1 peroxiredoxin [Myxococcales bacterium]